MAKIKKVTLYLDAQNMGTIVVFGYGGQTSCLAKLCKDEVIGNIAALVLTGETLHQTKVLDLYVPDEVIADLKKGMSF